MNKQNILKKINDLIYFIWLILLASIMVSTTYFYNNRSRDYKKTITVKKIGNEKKCLTFRWSKAKLDGTMIDDNSYTYCPKKGFTKIVSHKSGKISMTLSGNMKATGTK